MTDTAHLPRAIRNGHGQREIGCTCGQWSRAWPGERMAKAMHARHVLEVNARAVWRAPVAEGQEVADGFGSTWTRCDRTDCDLQVVRPGKAQCHGGCDVASQEVAG